MRSMAAWGLWGVVAAGSWLSAGAAEPTDQRADFMLNSREQRDSQELHAQTEKTLRDAEKAVQGFVEALNANRLKPTDMLNVGKAWVMTQQLERNAARLSNLGEPAGEDVRQRMSDLRQQMQEIIQACKAAPGANQALSKGMQVLISQTAKKKKSQMPALERLLAEKKLEEAEELVLEVLDDLNAMGIWFNADLLPYKDFISHSNQLPTETNVLRRDRGIENLQADLQANRPDFAALQAELAQAAQSVGASGQAQADNQQLAGPAVLASFGRRWQQAQLAAYRCQGLELAYQAMGVPVPEPGKLLDDQQRFDTAFRGGLAALIEADAARASAAEAEMLYPLYLQELAALQALCVDASLLSIVQPALEKLIAKSPALAAQVSAYRLATDDLLRWRRRGAESRARGRLKEFPDLETRYFELAGGKGEAFKLSPMAGQDRRGGTLGDSAPVILGLMQPALVEQNVSVKNVLGMRNQGGASLSGFQGVTCARLPKETDVAAALKALQYDLLLGTAGQPLTLEAATALASARSGDFQRAGGRVVQAGLNAFIPRLTNMTDSDWGLARLGPLAALPGGEHDLRNRVLVRLDIAPAWVQHEYFFADLAAPSAADDE